MADDPDRYMLLELEKKLDEAERLPAELSPDDVAAIGRGAELTDLQSYRRFDRLHRQGKIIGNKITVKDHPAGWIGYLLEDVQL
jgi:hypothetical protein